MDRTEADLSPTDPTAAFSATEAEPSRATCLADVGFFHDLPFSIHLSSFADASSWNVFLIRNSRQFPISPT